MPVSILARTLDGRSNVFEFEDHETPITVLNLRHRVAEFWDYDFENVRVLHNGRYVLNNHTFTESSTINIVLSQPPFRLVSSNSTDQVLRPPSGSQDSLNTSNNQSDGQNQNDANPNTTSSPSRPEDFVMIHSIFLDYGNLATPQNSLQRATQQVVNNTVNNIMRNSVINGQQNRPAIHSGTNIASSSTSNPSENLLNSTLSSLISHLNYLNNQNNVPNQSQNSMTESNLITSSTTTSDTQQHQSNSIQNNDSSNQITNTSNQNSIVNPSNNLQLYDQNLRRFIEMFVTLSNHLSRAAAHSQDFSHRLSRLLINNIPDFTSEFTLNYSEAIFSILHALSHALHNFSSFNLTRNMDNRLILRSLSSDDFINEQLANTLSQTPTSPNSTPSTNETLQSPTTSPTNVQSPSETIYRMRIDTNLPCNSRHYVTCDSSLSHNNTNIRQQATNQETRGNSASSMPSESATPRRIMPRRINQTIRPLNISPSQIMTSTIGSNTMNHLHNDDSFQLSMSIHSLFVSIVEDIMNPAESSSTIDLALNRQNTTLNPLMKPFADLHYTDGQFALFFTGYFNGFLSSAQGLFEKAKESLRELITSNDPISHIRRPILRTNNLISQRVINFFETFCSLLSNDEISDPNQFLNHYRNILIAINFDSNCLPLVHSSEYDRGLRKIKELIRMARISFQQSQTSATNSDQSTNGLVSPSSNTPVNNISTEEVAQTNLTDQNIPRMNILGTTAPNGQQITMPSQIMTSLNSLFNSFIPRMTSNNTNNRFVASSGPIFNIDDISASPTISSQENQTEQQQQQPPQQIAFSVDISNDQTSQNTNDANNSNNTNQNNISNSNQSVNLSSNHANNTNQHITNELNTNSCTNNSHVESSNDSNGPTNSQRGLTMPQCSEMSMQHERELAEHSRKYIGTEFMPRSLIYNQFNNSAKLAKIVQPIISETSANPLKDLLKYSINDENNPKIINQPFQQDQVIDELSQNLEIKRMIKDLIKDRAKIDPNFDLNRHKNIQNLLQID